MDHPIIPQELQDEVVHGIADDTAALREASLVNWAWRETSHRHLFSSLAIRATACRPVVASLDEHDDEVFRDFLPGENPSRSFRDILTILPHSFDNRVTALVLRAASMQDRMKNAALGIQLVKPELDACTVLAFLQRYPQIESLEIEDVDWVDCPDTDLEIAGHCNCILAYTPHPFSKLALRRISHRGTSSNATFVMQAASSINDLVIDGLSYDESEHPPYPTVPVKAFTLGISRQPWGAVTPNLGQSSLRRLHLLPVTWVEIEWVRQIVQAHRNTLEEFQLRIWWSGAEPSFWADLGLSQCTLLRSVTLFYTAHAASIHSLMVTQEILLNLVVQLPPSVKTLRLSFQSRSSSVTSYDILLSPSTWEELVVGCREVAELRTLELYIHLQDGGSSPTPVQTASLLSEIDGLFNAGVEPKLDIIITWENSVPQPITYDSDFQG